MADPKDSDVLSSQSGARKEPKALRPVPRGRPQEPNPLRPVGIAFAAVVAGLGAGKSGSTQDS